MAVCIASADIAQAAVGIRLSGTEILIGSIARHLQYTHRYGRLQGAFFTLYLAMARARVPDEEYMNQDKMDQIERLQQFSLYVWEGKHSGLSRREFLKRGLSLGLSLPAIYAVLTGCGVDQATPAAVRPTSTATPIPPTATNQPTATPTDEPTATPTDEPTAMPTDEPTATPVAQQPVRFAVIGDFGWAGAEEAAVADLVKSWEPDFIVTTGDNNYPRGSAETIDENVGQYYHMFMKHTGSAYGPEADRNRFFPVIGNHDTDIDLGKPYLDYFVLPGNERYYVVEDWPPVKIFAVNSVPWIEDDGIYADSVQAFWLRDQLAASPDTWNVVVFHHPPYGSGWKGPSSWMRWPFQEWGAHVVLNGHNHVYERIELNGFTYLTNGMGGGPRYAWGDTIAEGSLVRFNAEHGAQLVEATEEQISFKFITASGELIDTYELRREADTAG